MQIGERLKQLRLRMNLTQEELAIRCDLSKGFISQVERDQSSPSIATLVDILECLGTTLAEFFREEAHEPVFRYDDAYDTVDEELGHTIVWIIPNAQKNEMEPILLKLRPQGRTKQYAPHAGEVFGYVLSGTVTLHIGERKWRVKKGDSFYYTASEPYHLINNSTVSDTTLLWVSAPPFF